MKTVRKQKANCFELAEGLSYGGFELPGVDCNNSNKMAMLVLELK